MTNKNKNGIFFVIDGTDGSGKKTQTDLLVARLKKEGYEVEVADFPQYGKKSAGMVEEYLSGKYGTAQEVGPYRASILYAVDRFDASFKIKKWLNEGKIVISNRYVTANMGHQGGKIPTSGERETFFKWLYELEYKIFEIPKPDLNIILHVPAEIGQSLVDNKGRRDYIGEKKRDLHEADIGHLKNAEIVYMEIANNFSDIIIIECAPGNNILPKEKIHELIFKAIQNMI